MSTIQKKIKKNKSKVVNAVKNAFTHREDDEVVIARILDAPRGVVWRAWTNPQHMRRWWGPKSFTVPAYEADVHEGGRYFGCMRSPSGNEFCSTGQFKEVELLKKLVMSDSFADKEGNAVPASYYNMGKDWPMEMQISVSFKDFDNRRKTMLSLRHSGLKGFSSEDRDDLRQGWDESLEKLNSEVKCAY